MLRLEHLFDRLGQLLERDGVVDHHFALVTLFEILDVASRADLKADLLKELERHRATFNAYRGNPQISESALGEVLGRIEQAHQGLAQMTGKAGHAITANEWLMSIRSRINIPGGTCEFDLPAYYAWQQGPAARRRQDLVQWTQGLMPLAQGVNLVMSLLRDGGTAQRVVASNGQYQQSLPQGKPYQLLRVRVRQEDGLVPEISGHRLMVLVRLMRPDAEGRLRPANADHAFELTLCP